MKFAIVTYGTEGDVRPFSALCRGLIDAGHEVQLLADAGTLDSAQALSVPTAPLAGDIRATLNKTSIAGTIARGGGFNVTVRALAKIANENSESWLRTIIEAGRSCDAIVAAGLAAFAGFSAAEFLGVKAIGAGMIPITATAAFPSPFLPPKWIPRFFNRVSHSTVNATLWRAFRERSNAARAKFNLPPRRSAWTDLPMIYGISPSLLRPPADWAADVQLCGQWLMPLPGWKPPSDLATFLAEGEAPIYVGFGSMSGFDNAPLLDSLIEGLAGRRVLFHAGWSDINPRNLPSTFFIIGDTPHEWLFPRTALAIHHGGSGTSHSASRAGIPSIVVPFAGDQFFWADRLRLAGVAPAAVDARRPKPAAFARALDRATSAHMRSKAQALGEMMRAENGVAKTIGVLERILAT